MGKSRTKPKTQPRPGFRIQPVLREEPNLHYLAQALIQHALSQAGADSSKRHPKPTPKPAASE
jgi:hypothetical protein